MKRGDYYARDARAMRFYRENTVFLLNNTLRTSKARESPLKLN